MSVSDVAAGEQGALLAVGDVAAVSKARRRKPALGVQEVAAQLPVARVLLDLQPAHLDREYDYLVPASMADGAVPGARVRARFGAQEVDGFVVARLAASDHDGRLLPLRRLVSPEPVLTPAVLRLVRAVAARWAGTTADVLRLAVPPRHARTEKELSAAGQAAAAGDGDALAVQSPEADRPAAAPDAWAGLWSLYRGGEAFVRHVTAGAAPKAVWTPLPGLAPPVDAGAVPTSPHWAAAVAVAVRAAVGVGRGVLVVVPDGRDVARVCAALETAGVPRVVRLTADDGAAPRYRAFLAAARGQARVVVGTRAAMFAPVTDLGLIVLWGDGEDSLAEPHAPYPHARQVLALRSDLEQAAFLLGSPGRTVHAQAMLATGWAREIAAPRDVLRARSPRVRALTSLELAAEGPGAAARIPTPAWRAARDALTRGPVLVQVPRTGYLPVVACARCRTPAACAHCHGPLALSASTAAPQCRWCGRLAAGWRCSECGSGTVRAVRVGSERTAEELGRAFPGVPVRVSATSAPGGVLDRVPARPALVVATPGAEPVADGGYAAALLLDAAVTTAWPGLDAGTRALHRWLAAAHLVRPASAGGQVLLVGDGAPGPTGALVRVDPATFADRELAERTELALPPAVRVAAVTGDRAAVAALVARVDLAGPTTTFGPVEVPPEPSHPAGARHDPATLDTTGDGSLFDGAPVRVLIRVPTADGDELARQLRASVAVRSAHREPGTVRVQLDPEEMV